MNFLPFFSPLKSSLPPVAQMLLVFMINSALVKVYLAWLVAQMAEMVAAAVITPAASYSSYPKY